ncbi:MAG: putative rane protein [Candidatus Angelobacter sp.]|nr:putative rane protein [Candidatus Angelobacter sp.]
MELLDRYLQAVRFWLPRAQQTDIIAELGDDLRSQIEDKESSMARPLNEDELVALLQQAGHPMRVAGRYLPQQSLIGPTLFPLYKFVLQAVTFGYLAPWILVWAGMMIFMPSYRASHAGLALLGTWASFWSLAFMLFGVITIVFAVLERFQVRIAWLNKWDPRNLPRVAHRKDRVSRVESIFGLAFSIVYIIWWLSLSRYGNVMFGPIAGFFYLNPALRAWYLPALAPACIVMVQQCVNLFRPQWLWLRAAALLLSDAVAIFIFISVARVHPYLMLAENANADAHHVQALVILNQVLSWSILVTVAGICIALIVHAYQAVYELRRLSKGSRNGAALPVSQAL